MLPNTVFYLILKNHLIYAVKLTALRFGKCYFITRTNGH